MRNGILWFAAFCCLTGGIVYLACGEDEDDVSYSSFIGSAEQGDFEEVVIDPADGTLEGRLKGGLTLKSHYAEGDIAERLRATGARVKVRAPDAIDIVSYVILALTIVGFIVFWRMMRGMMRGGDGGNPAMNFTRSKLRRWDPRQLNVRFADVLGIDETRQEIEEWKDFAVRRQDYLAVHAQPPSGIMLIGPPGCGKTMLARALACEAGVPFFTISGSDFVELFVGVGAARVRDTMETVRMNAPCILFIDEIDAVGRHRGSGFGNQNEEREQTLNQLLVELDGFMVGSGVLILAATNRPDILDPALLRPGRFDRQVYVPAPDVRGREAIIAHYAESKPVAPDVDFAVLARRTVNCTGADLRKLVNEAAIRAARAKERVIRMAHFEEALDTHFLGIARRVVMMDEEKERVAWHEAGHALIATLQGDSPVHKVTIIPRNLALGLTMTLSEEDRYLSTEESLRNLIMMLFGGRAAEEVRYGDRSSGASSDMQHATDYARRMVALYGMSDQLGPVSYLQEQGSGFLGQAYGERSYAEDTLREIDLEVRKILVELATQTAKLLRENRSALEGITQALMEHETIDGVMVREIVRMSTK